MPRHRNLKLFSFLAFFGKRCVVELPLPHFSLVSYKILRKIFLKVNTRIISGRKLIRAKINTNNVGLPVFKYVLNGFMSYFR